MRNNEPNGLRLEVIGLTALGKAENVHHVIDAEALAQALLEWRLQAVDLVDTGHAQ